MLGFRVHHPFQGPLTHLCDLEAGYGGCLGSKLFWWGSTGIRTPDLLLESQECNHYATGGPPLILTLFNKFSSQKRSFLFSEVYSDLVMDTPSVKELFAPLAAASGAVDEEEVVVAAQVVSRPGENGEDGGRTKGRVFDVSVQVSHFPTFFKNISIIKTIL